MSIEKIELTPNDYASLIDANANVFNSTLLDIFYNRSNKISPSNLLKNYQNKYSVFEISKIDPRIYNEISNIFFNSVDKDFECVELSPINPFGLNAVLTETNQNNVLSASRNSEVVSDSSISMALECAYRIKKLKINKINLASSMRLLRMQNYGNGKKSHWSQHFRACSLISCFRNTNDNMLLTFVLQINNWLNMMKNLKDVVEYDKINVNICYIPLVKEIFKNYSIQFEEILSNTVNPNFDIFAEYGVNLPYNIDDIKTIEQLKTDKDYLLSIKNTYNFFRDNIFNPLKIEHSDVNYKLQLNRKSGLTYYDNICYEIELIFKDGKSLTLVDGGMTDWVGKLLSDSKEKCISSGMGLEYLGKVYKKKYECTDNRG